MNYDKMQKKSQFYKRPTVLRCDYSSFLALGTANITVRIPAAPAMGTMIFATESLGIKNKTESSTIAAIMPQAPAFCAKVIPPRRRAAALRQPYIATPYPHLSWIFIGEDFLRQACELIGIYRL